MKKLTNIFLCVLFLFPFGNLIGLAQTRSSSSLNTNYEQLVSRADLNYDTPVFRSEDGIPVGNGRMGTLVWTTPNAIHYQINRVDVFPMGCNTTSFPDGHNNYANGLGYVDIHTQDYGDDVFTGRAFNQHLSVYDGLTTVAGNGLKARMLNWMDGDVIAAEIDDQRSNSSAIHIDLQMLRYAVSYIYEMNWELTSNNANQIATGEHEDNFEMKDGRKGGHTATSRLDIRDGKILLIQEFKEDDYYCASAIAVGIIGRNSKAAYYNKTTVRLTAEPGKGSFLILLGTACSFDPKEDIGGLALKQLALAQPKGFNGLLQENRTWWGNFWPKSFVRLHSADGAANDVEKNFMYYLYLMASCSRGEYMPGFRGLIWKTNGDMAMWGSQYWWNNNGCYYNGFTPLNHPELVEPLFNTFYKHYDSYATAAKQQWGSQGIWIPETTWFNGLEVLPDNIADEMRALYLARKPWAEKSKDFLAFAANRNDLNSRWNFKFLNRSPRGDAAGPFAWTSHIMSATAKITYIYWANYAYHLDKEWLRTVGYPMIKGCVEFYCNFPNLVKESDGKYHLHYVNNLESSWGGKDTPEELLAMHAMLPIGIKAAEILGVDGDRCRVWKEILDNLTPIPDSNISATYYDYTNIGTKDSELFNTNMEAYKRRNSTLSANTRVSVLSRTGVIAANLGLAEDVRYLIPAQIRSGPENCDSIGVGNSGLLPLRNRLQLREGPGAIEFERLGNAINATCKALLQSIPATPGGEPVNYIFPAWPKEWDAQFMLAARNAFVISASQEGGVIEFVEIQSEKGGRCLVQNPWQGKDLTVYRNGRRSGNMSGQMLTLTSRAGDVITLVPRGASLPKKEVQ